MKDFDTIIPETRSSRPCCVLFADLVGSTALFESLGNTVAAELVTQSTDIMSAAVKLHGGHVVKVLGDGVLAVFDKPEKALSAGRALREAIARGDLHVAVGVEYGDVLAREMDVFGDAVNVAARLSDVAQRGEILLGEGAYAALDYVWRAACRSLAQIPLKGKSEPIAVWRFEQRDEMQTGPFTAFHHSTASVQMPVKTGRQQVLLTLPDGEAMRFESHKNTPLMLGRTRDSHVTLDDARVSRSHASVVWQVDHFVLTDHSSNGTWLQLEPRAPTHVLRRASMSLVGKGKLALGANLEDTPELTLGFEVTALH